MAMRDVEQMELHLQSHLQAMQQLAGGPVGGSGGPLVGGTLVGGGMVLDGMEQAAHLTVDAVSEGMIRPNQLTLSFQGQLSVFDSVSTEKVQSVLLFLGGQELPREDKSVHFHQDHKVLNDVPLSSNDKHRQASLMRFKEKRKGRCFEKKVRYQVRKDVAQRMQRKKGQFVSSKVSLEDLSSTPTHSNLSLGSFREQVQHETFCQHCGCSQISTPLMRHGPGGPKSLCNACGLTWATKGTLRDLPTISATGIQGLSVKQEGTSML